MNAQKGAISTAAAIIIVIVILVLVGIAYWYVSSNPPATTTTPGSQASSTTNGSSNGSSSGSSVTTGASGQKEYSNFTYGYAVSFPPDAQNSLSTANNVSFGFSTGTSTPAATLRIATELGVSQVAYCMTVPQGAKAVATTTINGVPFLSYTSGGDATLTSTTYYRLVHKGPAGNTCYDIQKSPQGSASLSSKLNDILQSFTFITSA